MIRTSADIFNSDSSHDISINQFIKESFIDFLSWWYVVMPVRHILYLRRILTIVDDKFSISYMIRTINIPWHRDYSFVGYLIGICVRVIFLIPSTIFFLLVLLSYLTFIIFWLLIPIISISLTIISPFI